MRPFYVQRAKGCPPYLLDPPMPLLCMGLSLVLMRGSLSSAQIPTL